MMAENNIRLTYHCDVELLTPVHIGSGDKYVEHFDFTYDYLTKKLTVFNRDKLLEQVAGSGEPGIQAFTKAVEEETLETWLRSKPDGINLDAARIHNFNCERKPRDISVQLRSSTSDALLAGSSLKGAFRTAVLAKLSHEENRRSVTAAKQELIRQHRVNQKFADRQISQTLLGPDAQKNLMRCLTVADCVFPAEAIKLENVILSRLVAKKQMAVKFGVILEKISEGSKGGCQISFDTYLGTKGQEYLGGRTAPTLEWLLDAVRRKTQKTINTELGFFDGLNGPHNNTIQTFYEKLHEKIGGIEENEVILQLAWGSGWNGMTGELLEKDELDNNLRKKLSLAPGHLQFPFPKSRRFALVGGQAVPMGWVKLSFTNKDEKKRLEAEQRAIALKDKENKDRLEKEKQEREKQWQTMDETEQDIAIVKKTDLAQEHAPGKDALKDVWPKLENSEPDIQKRLAQAFIKAWENNPEAWRKKQCSNSQWEKVEKLIEITGIAHPDIQQFDADEQKTIEDINALNDFGQFISSKITMDDLSLAAGEALKAKFSDWGCNNKKAKKNKLKEWNRLNNILRQLRRS